MIVPERLRDLIEGRTSQSELARRVGISQGAIASLLSGRSAGSKHLHRIAQELGTTPAYLLGETDDASAGAIPTPTAHDIAEHLDSVLVPLYDLKFSMGGGAYFDDSAPFEMVPFKKGWLRSHLAGRLDQVMLITGKGDSMKPTIDDGDVLMVDRSQTTVRDPDLIWAFNYGESGMVKRLRRLPKGGYLVQSDNAVVREFSAVDDEVHIVGRVVSILRWQ